MAQNHVLSLLPLQLISAAAQSDREFLNAEEFARRLREFGGGKQE